MRGVPIGTNWGDEEGREAAEIGNGSEESIGTNWGDGEGRKGAGKRKWERGVSIGTDWGDGEGKKGSRNRKWEECP